MSTKTARPPVQSKSETATTRDGRSGHARSPRTRTQPQAAETATVPWTLEDRVRMVRNYLVLIQAASQGLEACDPNLLPDAITQATEDALDLLEPFDQVPLEMANWRPDDEDATPRSGGAR